MEMLQEHKNPIQKTVREKKKKLVPDASQALVHPSSGLLMAACHCRCHCLSWLVDGLLLAVEGRGKKEEAGRVGG